MNFREKITLKPGQDLFFTSDTHYNHKNICEGVSEWKNTNGEVPKDKTRDFNTLEEMNSTLVNNINNEVGENDILFHDGDWSFGGFESIKEFRDRINCKNVYLVLGNHDEKIRDNQEGCQGYFVKVFPSYCELEVIFPQNDKKVKAEKQQFILSHYPIASWNYMNKGTIHLHGHCHLPYHLKFMPGKGMDVGVDGNNLTPYNVKEIISIMKDKPQISLFQFDHHSEELG